MIIINSDTLFDLSYKYDEYFYVKNHMISNHINIRIMDAFNDNTVIRNYILISRNNNIITDFMTRNDIECLNYINFLVSNI